MTIDVKTLMADGEFFGRVAAGGGTIDGVDIPALVAGDRATVVADTGLNTVTANVVLSTGLSGGDTLAGGVGAAEDLTLASTTHATRGDLNLRDQVTVLSESKTHSSSSTAFYALKANPSLAMSGTTTGQVLNMVDISPTVDWTANPNSLVTHTYVQVKPAVSHNAATRTMNNHAMFLSGPTYTGTTNVMTVASHTCFSSAPTVTGTVTTTALVGFSAGLTVGAGSTVSNYVGVLVASPTVNATGTLTSSIGLSVQILGGATPIGIQVNEPIVHPPKNLVLVTDSAIPIDRAVVRLTPTSEVTWGPTADSPADGTNGQMLTLVNTSVYNINLKNTTADAQSRFVFSSQMTNRFVLLPSCAVTFVYSSTVDKWCQVGGSPSILAYNHGSLGTSSAIDPTKGDYQTCTTTTSHSLTATDTGVAGDNLTLLITNDATTGRVITFSAPGFQSTGTLTGTISKKAQITFRSNGTSWYEVSRSLGMT